MEVTEPQRQMPALAIGGLAHGRQVELSAGERLVVTRPGAALAYRTAELTSPAGRRMKFLVPDSVSVADEVDHILAGLHRLAIDGIALGSNVQWTIEGIRANAEAQPPNLRRQMSTVADALEGILAPPTRPWKGREDDREQRVHLSTDHPAQHLGLR